MTNVYHVIKDPVHGTMSFSSIENRWVKPFIDSAHFQRLRHIKQLGLGDYIFPGAVHTRFNHSLGCCYVGRQIARKIDLADDERQLVMIACLLHDIGHGPFSHALDGVFRDKAIHHEDWTPYFLADYANEAFFDSYNKKNKSFPLTKEKFSMIADMIMHKPITKPLLADIVSSQLDADRFDYLLRDGHFCGVRYGEFDYLWMLHCLTRVKSDGVQRLGITYKGVGVVEHYLMARRLMRRNISFSPKKLAIEYYLVQFLLLLSQDIETNKLFESILHSVLGKFLLSVNQFNQNKEADKNQFLEKNAPYYKTLGDYDVFAVIKQLNLESDHHPAVQLAKRIQNRNMPKFIYLKNKNVADVKIKLQQFKTENHKKYQNWQMALIEAPHQSYSKADDPIFVSNQDGTIDQISSSSVILDILSDQFEHAAFVAIDDTIANDQLIVSFLKSLG